MTRVVLLVALVCVVRGIQSLSASPPLLAQTAGQILSAGDHSFVVDHGGRRRSYLVHLPRNAANHPRPVVLAFHGGAGEAEGFKGYAGLDKVAVREAPPATRTAR